MSQFVPLTQPFRTFRIPMGGSTRTTPTWGSGWSATPPRRPPPSRDLSTPCSRRTTHSSSPEAWAPGWRSSAWTGTLRPRMTLSSRWMPNRLFTRLQQAFVCLFKTRWLHWLGKCWIYYWSCVDCNLQTEPIHQTSHTIEFSLALMTEPSLYKGLTLFFSYFQGTIQLTDEMLKGDEQVLNFQGEDKSGKFLWMLAPALISKIFWCFWQYHTWATNMLDCNFYYWISLTSLIEITVNMIISAHNKCLISINFTPHEDRKDE